MQDRNAEFTVRVYVWMGQWTSELKGRRGVRIVVWKRHGGLKICTIVEGRRVKDDESDTPGEYVIVL